MYRIVGADGRQYGPVPEAVLRRWIAEGRANANTPAILEGTTEWKPLSTYPAFADLAAPPVGPGMMPPIQPAAAPAPKLQTSSMAVAGFVCALLGLMCCGPFLSIPGLIFSIIGLVEIRKQPHRLSGEGWAIAGIVLSIVGLVVGILALATFLAGLPFGRVHRFNRWYL